MTRAAFGSATTADGPVPSCSTTLADGAAAWALKARGLSRTTLERLGVASGTAFFPDAGQELPCLFFPYRWRGLATGWKARS